MDKAMGLCFSKIKNNPKMIFMKKDYLDEVRLIRSIQRAEGNMDCFRKNPEDCDQPECIWRPYCLSLGQERDNSEDN